MSFESNRPLSSRVEKRVISNIRGLEGPAKSLLKRISPEIEKGSYNCILGIDASGRIPTLVLSGVIKKRYKEKNFPPLSVLFVAGGQRIKMSAKGAEQKASDFSAYLQKLLLDEAITREKKLLLVEDTAISGESIKNLSDVLKENNITFDVAIFAADDVSQERWKEKIGADVYVGQWGEASGYGKHDLTGVKKKHGELFSEPFNSLRGKATLISARSEVKQLVDDLDRWYAAEVLP